MLIELTSLIGIRLSTAHVDGIPLFISSISEAILSLMRNTARNCTSTDAQMIFEEAVMYMPNHIVSEMCLRRLFSHGPSTSDPTIPLNTTIAHHCQQVFLSLSNSSLPFVAPRLLESAFARGGGRLSTESSRLDRLRTLIG